MTLHHHTALYFLGHARPHHRGKFTALTNIALGAALVSRDPERARAEMLKVLAIFPPK